jgi:hypothetical protein
MWALRQFLGAATAEQDLKTREPAPGPTEVPTEIKDRHPWLQAIDYG